MTICAELLKIMEQMEPQIKQFYSSKWLKEPKRMEPIPPARDAEVLYQEFLRRHRNHAE